MWYIYAILASLFFTGMVLCVKKLTDDLKFSSERVLFFVFLFLFLGFLIMDINSLPLVLKSKYFLPLISLTFIGGIFSAIGNWADFKGIKRASNAGYAVAVRNSSILITTLVSVFLFGSELTLFRFGGILAILIGMTLLVVEKKKEKKKNEEKKEKGVFPWYVFSFIAFFTLAIVILITKEATLLADFSIQNINLFLFGFSLLIFSLMNRKKLKGYVTDKKDLKIFLFLVIGAALFSFMANFVKIIGLDLAPNPGYNDAIVKSNVLFVTLFSLKPLKLFSAELNKQKVLGVIVITVGLIMMVI